MFVIISDALRYEIGREIVDNIKTDSVLKGGTTINYAISPLPSETRFGMANLLPHKTIEYADKAVFVDGKPTNSISASSLLPLPGNTVILSILVDTFISKISLPMQPVPEIRSISGA